MKWRRRFPDVKLLCAGAAVVVLASVGSTWHQARQLRRLRSTPVGIRLSEGGFPPEEVRKHEAVPREWTEPAAVADGWHFDVFTPAAVYYDVKSGEFSVKPAATRDEAGTVSGLELLAVKAEPYRVQLAGYFGGPHAWVGAFVSPDQPGSFLARPGQRLADLGVVVQSLNLKRGPAPDLELVAEAVVRDEVSGVDVTLESRRRKFTDSAIAVVRTPNGEPALELRAGDTVATEDAIYRIERIQLDPPEVIASQSVSGRPGAEICVLHPIGTDARQIGVPSPGPAEQPAASIASAAK